MIIARTPLRISLGGGGTDLPSYFSKSGEGFLVAAAINKYIYVAVHQPFVDRYFLKYSELEDVGHVNDIRHPIIREALRLTQIPPGLEVASLADIPAGTGLGSSGTFTVGLLNALLAYSNKSVPRREIAQLACQLEIDTLKQSVGKQDQYISAVGGLSQFTFHGDGSVSDSRVPLSKGGRQELEENLLLFYTGLRRNASEELSAFTDTGSSGDQDLRANLDEVREIGHESALALANEDFDYFGALLTKQWQLKHARSRTQIHERIDGWLSLGLQAGAIGGKLVGAGGGGFLLFLAPDKNSLRRAMGSLGLVEVHFGFDDVGTTLMPW